MSMTAKTDLGRKIEKYVTGQFERIFDRRMVTTLLDGSMAETVSYDPQEASADPVPVIIPRGMQVEGGSDVIVVSVGGEWIVGWVLR